MLSGFVADSVPHRYVEVDSARLLLLLARFALPIGDDVRALRTFPQRPVARHFTPEYYLQKLDFLVRYPGYFAYELVAFHKRGAPAAANCDEMAALVRQVITEREPELLTLPFRRFWRGAYERLDNVEAWWYSRGLVYTCQEARGGARPQKHYFVTDEGLNEARQLAEELASARWYADRIDLIHRFFGGLTPGEVKDLQYRHASYREAQLEETIPDLTAEEIRDAFAEAFGEALEAPNE